MDTATQKKHLRQSIAERMKHVRPQDRDAESRSICRRIKQEWSGMPTVCTGFFPMPSEPDILALLAEWMQAGSCIYLPRTEGMGFTFRHVPSLEALVPGPFGMLEPPRDAQPLDLATVDLVLVPGAGFDDTCNRIGRGNGGYDRWLAQLRSKNPDAHVWGVCLEAQRTRDIPLEPHDQPMDAVITARGIIRRGQPPSW